MGDRGSKSNISLFVKEQRVDDSWNSLNLEFLRCTLTPEKSGIYKE